jgi:hypothetical protein
MDCPNQTSSISRNFYYLLFCEHLRMPSSVPLMLKVPKREIFNRSDFPDFYTIKPLRVGDFEVKIKKKLKIFRGSFRGAKFPSRMLSLFLRRFFKFWPKIFFFC